MREKQIHVYYHVCLKNDGMIIALQQLHLLSISGLLYRATRINIGIKYINIDDRDNFLRMIDQYNLLSNIHILYCEENSLNNNQELSTAIHFKNYADSLPENTDDFILYFHSKGITHYKSFLENSIRHWRIYMEYFMVNNWRDCVNKLFEGYESCGTFTWDVIKIQDKLHTIRHMNPDDIPSEPHDSRIFYPGTFYWMNTSLIKKIPIKYFYFENEYGRSNIELLPAIVDHKFYAFSSPNPPEMNIVNTVIHPLQYIR